MPSIVHEIYIEAPISICFDLARDVGIHMETASHTKEKAIAGVLSGRMEKGDVVTWEAVHFGRRQQLTARIIDMEKPYRFTDVMVKGAFHSFIHTHEFSESGNGTLMKDKFVYKSPLGILGKLADKLFLAAYMERFIVDRAIALKNKAEQTENERLEAMKKSNLPAGNGGKDIGQPID